MNANKAGNTRRRRTVVYETKQSSGAEADLRDSLDLLANILSSYEDTVISCTRVLLSTGGGDEEVNDKPRRNSVQGSD
jgi:hypothetical protein